MERTPGRTDWASLCCALTSSVDRPHTTDGIRFVFRMDLLAQGTRGRRSPTQGDECLLTAMPFSSLIVEKDNKATGRDNSQGYGFWLIP